MITIIRRNGGTTVSEETRCPTEAAREFHTLLRKRGPSWVDASDPKEISVWARNQKIRSLTIFVFEAATASQRFINLLTRVGTPPPSQEVSERTTSVVLVDAQRISVNAVTQALQDADCSGNDNTIAA